MVGLAILMGACHKEKNAAVQQSGYSANSGQGALERSKYRINSSKWNDGWCRSPRLDCVSLDDVVIIGRVKRNLEQAISSGSLEEIRLFFEASENNVLAGALGESTVGGIQDGTLEIQVIQQSNQAIVLQVQETSQTQRTGGTLYFQFNVSSDNG